MPLTFHLHLSFRRGPKHRHPRKSQQPHPDNRPGADQQRQTEKHCCYQRIIEIEEPRVVPETFGNETGNLLDVKRLLLPDAEEYRGGAEVLPVEHLLLRQCEGVLRALGEVRLGVREGVLGATVFPDIFSVIMRMD